MNFKNKIPLHIFIAFEFLPVLCFTSTHNTNNHYHFYFNSKFYYMLNNYLIKDLFCSTSYLIDTSIVDFEKTQQNWFLKIFQNTNKSFLLFTHYFIYYLNLKVTIFSFLSSSTLIKSINTVEDIFYNANWLEREVSEMFGIFFYKKLDTRNLLLEYNTMNHPFLKNFSCEGNFEIYYNIFENTTTQLYTESIEL